MPYLYRTAKNIIDKVQMETASRGQTIQADEKSVYTRVKIGINFTILGGKLSQYNITTCTSIKLLTFPQFDESPNRY